MMKHILIATFLFGSIGLFAQKTPEVCNGLPYAKVDQSASLKSDIEKLISKNLPAEMEKGTFNASYKFYVTCNGDIDKRMYHNGNLSEKNQHWLNGIMGKTTWNAAVKDDVYVTSTVFVQVEIVNGQVKLAIE